MTLTRPSLFCRLRASNNSDGWKEFAETYSPILNEYAQAYGRCEHDKCDIVQSVWVILVRLIPQFDYQPQRGKFRHLLRRIVKNTAIDWGRRQNSMHQSAESLEQIPSPQAISDGRSARWGLLQRSLEIVRSRSTKHAWSCFEGHVLGRRSAADVGAELGLTANAVYVNASRVLGHVRRISRIQDVEACHD